MALNNENNPQILLIPLGSLATDNTQVPGFKTIKKMKIKSVKLINGAAIAASDTDFVQVGLQLVGSTVLAELDSRAAHENGLAKNVGKGLNLVVDEIAAGADVEVDYQEGGTVALTSAVLQVEMYPF